jgi:uncharacterized coiled-coil DUF342 family protein
MTTPDSNFADSLDEIDWEARCGELVTQGMRASARHKTRMSELALERDQLKLRVRELEQQVAKLAPAAEKLRESERRREEELRAASAKVFQARQEVKDLKRRHAAGQKGVLQDTITWLQQVADKFPSEPATAGLLELAE